MRRAESVEFAMRAEGGENGKDSESDWGVAGGELGMDCAGGERGGVGDVDEAEDGGFGGAEGCEAEEVDVDVRGKGA